MREPSYDNRFKLADSNRCPRCHYKLDGASGGTGAPPKAGDYSVCIMCAAMLVFTPEAAKGLRLMTEEEQLDLPGDARAELHRVQRAVILTNLKLGKGVPDREQP